MSSATGLTAAGMDHLRAAAERHVADEKVPGLVALVARGGQVHVEALGRLAVDGAPVARDSIFRIASTTKPITAAATLALAAEGLFGLDDPVYRLLPELAGRRVLRRMDGSLEDTVPAARAITVRDLLTFTFGFGMVGEMFASPEPWPVVAATQELRLATIGPPDPPVPPDPDTWIARLGSLPLLAQPGERWMYNTGAQVLGVLAARATGQPFGEVLRTRIFEPLGMRDTAFWTAQTERLATEYQPTPDGLVVRDEPGGDWSRPPEFDDAAAGLVSTADDLLAFARMLLRGGAPVLPPDAVRAMTTDQLTPAQKAHGGLMPGFFDGGSWGFCLAVDEGGAFGWDGGLGTTWLVDPSRDLTVIVLTQRMFESADRRRCTVTSRPQRTPRPPEPRTGRTPAALGGTARTPAALGGPVRRRPGARRRPRSAADRRRDMRVAMAEELGGIDSVELGERPDPAPAAGQALVRVHGAGAGPWDVGFLRGGFPGVALPFVPGQEVAGVVEAAGDGSGVQRGERVYASLFPAGGGFAELALASADRLAPMPERASFQEAAGLVIGAGTAHEGLADRGRLQPGETVLITAAAGGVGSSAVQIAAALGARPLAVASPGNHDYLRSLGAGDVFDYHAADWVQQVRAAVPAGVDLLLDGAGGQTRDQAIGAVRDGGRVISIVLQGPPAQFERGITGESFAAHVDRSRLEVLRRLVDAGRLRPQVQEVLPLDRARDALARVAGGHTRGKIVLRIGQ